MAVLSPEQREEAERIKGRYPEGRERSAIMPLLYLVQSVEGWVSPEGMREVAGLLGLTTAEVQAVATFYTMLRTRPTGRHLVAVCTNLSCTLLGATDLLEAGRAAVDADGDGRSADGEITIVEEECLGACDAAPLVQANVANFDRMDRARFLGLLEALRAGERPVPARGEMPRDFRSASRMLAGLEPEVHA